MTRQQLKAAPTDSLSRADLLVALNMARVALGKVTFVPVLSHFCFTGTSVEAYDDTMAVSVAFESTVSGAVPGDNLLKLLASMSSNQIRLESKDGHLHVVAGRSKLKLPMLPREAFVFDIDAVTSEQALGTWTVTDAVAEGLTRCLISVGFDPTHPAQMGVTVMPDGTLYSTDNVTMSRFVSGCAVDVDSAELLPTAFCQTLVAMQKSLGVEAELSFYDTGVLARFGKKAYLYSKTMAIDKPLDFGGVFQKMVPARLSLASLPDSWEQSFSRASMLADVKTPICTVAVQEGEKEGQVVLLLETSSASGQVYDRVETDAAFTADSEFKIDPAHVMRASKVCSQFGLAPRALVMRDGKFTHLMTHAV